MWGQAVVHSNMPALFFQKEGHFGLVAAGPVGEGYPFLVKCCARKVSVQALVAGVSEPVSS